MTALICESHGIEMKLLSIPFCVVLLLMMNGCADMDPSQTSEEDLRATAEAIHDAEQHHQQLETQYQADAPYEPVAVKQLTHGRQATPVKRQNPIALWLSGRKACLIQPVFISFDIHN